MVTRCDFFSTDSSSSLYISYRGVQYGKLVLGIIFPWLVRSIPISDLWWGARKCEDKKLRPVQASDMHAALSYAMQVNSAWATR
jgi:hypothetical protein